MRMIGLLLTLAILGYVISIYINSSVETTQEGESYTSRPQQTIEHTQDMADQLNQSLKHQQQKLKEAD